MTLKEQIQADMKTALRAGEKDRLGVLRLLWAAIRQREIDERTSLNDPEVIAVLDKLVKHRRESIAQYERAGRDELAAQERAEIVVIQEYLPQPLTEAEIEQRIDAAIAETGAQSMKDMGKVMALLKAPMQGRADMAAVSAKVKGRLASSWN
jgi:uncharacterized protein YqeY